MTSQSVNLGAFSISLAVSDLKKSIAFYNKLGFIHLGGDEEKNYVILKNGEHVIGLFQGMFENNILTFNPGWDQSAEETETFTDVREIQRHLKERDIDLMTETDESTTGPGSLMLTDPDGNTILIDQHR